MLTNSRLFKIIITLLLFYNHLSFALNYKNHDNQQTLTISPQIALPIGVKIWFNECGGSVNGLTSWNDGENFASLGIGHFLWHPYSNKKRASFSGGFPRLIRYIEKRGGYNIPTWLRGNGALYCPWNNQKEFLQAQNSPRMMELRNFLKNTIPVQAECMVKHLQETLPDMLKSAPAQDRPFIYHKFYTLAKTPSGIYALVDYLNFKGAGVSNSKKNYKYGTGLLHVLKGMQHAPKGSTPLQAYTWSAKKALVRRVEQSRPSQNPEIWLSGWFNRVNTYLKGDQLGTRVALKQRRFTFEVPFI